MLTHELTRKAAREGLMRHAPEALHTGILALETGSTLQCAYELAVKRLQELEAYFGYYVIGEEAAQPAYIPGFNRE